METELFAAARRASGLRVADAACISGISRPTYNMRERFPLDFRLGELRAVYGALDPVGRRLLLEAVTSVFDAEEVPSCD